VNSGRIPEGSTPIYKRHRPAIGHDRRGHGGDHRRLPDAAGKDGGVHADVRSEDLSTTLVDHALAETGVTSDHVDDLMWGVA
jgi:hypothetical protein